MKKTIISLVLAALTLPMALPAQDQPAPGDQTKKTKKKAKKARKSKKTKPAA